MESFNPFFIMLLGRFEPPSFTSYFLISSVQHEESFSSFIPSASHFAFSGFKKVIRNVAPVKPRALIQPTDAAPRWRHPADFIVKLITA